MWCKFRHKVAIEILRPFFKVLFKVKYNLSIKKEKLPEEGSIILSNHAMTLDPFSVGLRFDKPLYYMASSDLFQNKFTGKIIKFLINPIPKQKSNKSDIGAIKACIQVAKENGNICIFPEGNRTFSGELGYIDYSIVKLIKKINKPLILMNINGGYNSDPRWGKTPRKGKLEVYIRKKYSVEEVAAMSLDELYNTIVENLTVDNYSHQYEYKGKNIAEDLERILYICPICGSMHTLHSKKDTLTCSSCNTHFKLDKKLVFSSTNEDFKFKYINEWYNYQVDVIKQKEFSEELIYSDPVKLFITKESKPKRLVGKCNMNIYQDKIVYKFDDNETILNFDDIKAITLVGKKKMNIYAKDYTYQVKNNGKTNLIKYMHLYYILENRKAGIVDGFIGI